MNPTARLCMRSFKGLLDIRKLTIRLGMTSIEVFSALSAWREVRSRVMGGLS